MDPSAFLQYCQKEWSEGGAAVEGLKEAVRVPNLTPEYDLEYHTNGLIQQVVRVAQAWIEAQGVTGLKTTVFAEPNTEPLLLVEIAATNPQNAKSVMTYGHLDKMPPLNPAKWSEGLSARNPVIRGPKIYGRGTNDDCYNPFAIITAIKCLQLSKVPHPRIVMILETGEESGEEQITKYMHQLRDRIGKLDLILVVDAGASDYTTTWCCLGLRGVLTGILSVEHLSAPCHSGMATGLVPDTFRLARQLVSRIEDENTGEIKVKECNLAQIPADAVRQCEQVAASIGGQAISFLSPLPGAHLMFNTPTSEIFVSENSKAKVNTKALAELLVNNTLRPGLAVTAAEGLPAIADGSNIIRTRTALKLSLRIPPGVDAKKAQAAVKAVLEANPPYGARVHYEDVDVGSGWFGGTMNPAVKKALNEATKGVFGKDPMFYYEGASIPLCTVLQELWGEAQILVTGAAGPETNAHSYDECLDLPYTAKFTAFMAALFGKLEQP